MQTTPVQLNLPRKSSVGLPGVQADSTDYYYFSLILGSLKPSGYYIYQQVLHSTFPRSAHIMYLCVFMALRTNSDYFPVQNKLGGISDLNYMCSLRGVPESLYTT